MNSAGRIPKRRTPLDARRRERLVDTLREQGIVDAKVLQAMGAIPRERFVDEALAGKVYRPDVALPIGEKQTISQPAIVARMCELAGPEPGPALEIGTGSGYHAAVLSRLFSRVYSVERIAALSRKARTVIRDLGIENVHFKIFDGSYGWSEFAPYRAIVVTAAAPALPEPLFEQLADGGRLVYPQADPEQPDRQQLILVRRNGDQPETEAHGACRFVPLLGRFGLEPTAHERNRH